MKSWKIIALFGCMILLARLGIQATIAVLVAAVIIEFGPDRLKKLRHCDREIAAAHMLVILACALLTILASAYSVMLSDSERAMLSSLASWLCIGVVFLVGAFHIVSFPIVVFRQPKPRRFAAPASAAFQRGLRKAS